MSRDRAWGSSMYRNEHTVRKESREGVILKVRIGVWVG